MAEDKTTLSDKIWNDGQEGCHDMLYLEDVKASMKKIKIMFCSGIGWDTIVKEHCKRGDFYYCTNCRKIDKELGGAFV